MEYDTRKPDGELEVNWKLLWFDSFSYEGKGNLSHDLAIIKTEVNNLNITRTSYERVGTYAHECTRNNKLTFYTSLTSFRCLIGEERGAETGLWFDFA